MHTQAELKKYQNLFLDIYQVTGNLLLSARIASDQLSPDCQQAKQIELEAHNQPEQ